MRKSYRATILFEEVDVPEEGIEINDDTPWVEVRRNGLITTPTDDVHMQRKSLGWLITSAMASLRDLTPDEVLGDKDG